MAIHAHYEAQALDLNPMSLRETGSATFTTTTPHGSGVTRAYAGQAFTPARPGGLAVVTDLARRTLQLWMERAAERRRLARLDARTLHDIGTTRAAVDYELSKPVWRA